MFIPTFWIDPDTLLRSTIPEAFALIRWELLAESEEVNFHPGPLHNNQHEQKENECWLGIDDFRKPQLWREPYCHHVTDEETESDFKSHGNKKHRGNLEIQAPRSKDKIFPPRLGALPLLTSPFISVFLHKMCLPSQVPRHLHCHFEFFSLCWLPRTLMGDLKKKKKFFFKCPCLFVALKAGSYLGEIILWD